MSKDKPIYFPSLYDTTDNNFNIWKKLGVTFTDGSFKAEVSRWPPGLADISYIPTVFFSPPVQEDLRPPTTFSDKLCELEIEIKEIELLMLMDERYDAQKYHFLKAVREKMIYDTKAVQARRKST